MTSPSPPLKFIDIDPNARLLSPSKSSSVSPRRASSSSSSSSLNDNSDSYHDIIDPKLLERAEFMVQWAISSKHENSPSALIQQQQGNGNNGGNDAADNNINTSNIIKAREQSILLNSLLNHNYRRKAPMATSAATATENGVGDHASDNHMNINSANFLRATLHAIISTNSGRELDRIVSSTKLHAQLLHLIMKLDPFLPPSSSETCAHLRELDKARSERKRRLLRQEQQLQLAQQQLLGNSSIIINNSTNSNNSTTTTTMNGRVQISESSIRHKENTKFVIPHLPYFQYQIADAHLSLLVTLVSHNASFSLSAVRSLWGMLTDFGSRWREWDIGRRKKERGEEEARILRGKEKILGEEEELALKEQLNQPQQQPEEERPVPGMNGLTVEFVRELLCMCNKDMTGTRDDNADVDEEEDKVGTNNIAARSDDDNEEEIYSDRLPSGRVRRILLALVNIFRLSPRSKSDLLREMIANFPYYKTCPPALYSWYIHMCLQMVHLVHVAFEGPILALLVDKALDMDVEIKINNGGAVVLDTATTDDTDHDLPAPATLLDEKKTSKRSFQQMSQGMPPTVVAGNAITPIKNNEPSILNMASGAVATAHTNEENEANHVIEISERLDILMTVLYQRVIQVTCYTPGSLPSAMAAVVQARRLYRQLDGVFDEKVRTTDRCKFVQFVFFVLFGRENDALEEVGKLLAKRENEMQHTAREIILETDDPDNSLSPSSFIGTDPLYRGFSAKLIDFFYNPNHVGDDFPRQTVVCYLASFVSRATYVCPETVCECVAALLRWAEAYISAQSEPMENNYGAISSKGDGVRRISSGTSLGNTQHPCELHALFYTACQAAFYIMCFRGAEALKYYRRACKFANDPESAYADPDSVDIGPERWKLLCGHALQPLTYCLESVRVEFLHLAEDLDLFVDSNADDVEDKKTLATKFIGHLWTTSSTKLSKQMPHGPNKIKTTNPKRRKSIIISTAATQEKKRLAGGVGGLGQGSNPLDSFFPFDPYLLQKSYIHVDPYYRNWEDCILSIDDETESNIHLEERLRDEHSDVSILDGEGDEDIVDDDEDDDEDSIGDEDDVVDGMNQPLVSVDQVPTTSNGVASFYEESHFEKELRRSRAMSTGSQCSW